MTDILNLNEVTEKHRYKVGGKAHALALMSKTGFLIPQAVCLTIDLYHQYMQSSGLLTHILMELYRKPFEEMRWEEIWDTALRIRNAFLKAPIPVSMRNRLASVIDSTFSGKAVSVRSSAPGEDSVAHSFAGLHESYVNVKGTLSILEHVRLVWASLWSDRALLYRQELGLDVEKSAMAVVIQEMINGDRAGIVFGKSPTNESETIIEAVYGLNQGLVDGSIEPDRWVLSRKTGKEISHYPSPREKAMRPAQEGIRMETLPPNLSIKPPLEKGEIQQVYELSKKAEALFGPPQDVEWTFHNRKLFALQARPITAHTEAENDERPWYLSLHRSFENLKDLRVKIEKDLLPSMEKEAMEWSKMDLSNQSNEALANEIERRMIRYHDWLDQYREDCIPFAHGMRLFGQIYNDIMRPEDPFEFTEILSRTGMKSIARNQMLEELALQIREDPEIKSFLRQDRLQECPPRFRERFDALLTEFGDLAWGDSLFIRDYRQLARLLIELSNKAEDKKPAASEGRQDELERAFVSRFLTENRGYAEEMIELGRASYRLRDDDNIYLGKIEGQMLFALEEGKRRLRQESNYDVKNLDKEDVVRCLRGSAFTPEEPPIQKESQTRNFNIKARQIVGQASGPGVAVGKARVIHGPSDLFEFKRGEILVCDAIDPGMTFVVPLAAGIVERRGGMLIHGAIIAREYGLPCVTGAPGAAEWIRTGETVTVDGFLGIVIISKRD